MAYPTNSLSVVLEDIDRRMMQLKSMAQRSHDTMAAGNVPSASIFDIFIRAKAEKTALQTAAATPGIADYAKPQKDDEFLDVVAEFNGVISAIDNVTNWIATNFPTLTDPISQVKYLSALTLGPNGPIDRQFTPAQTAGLRTVLQSLIATID